jgi:hypothetical protein
MQLPIDHNQVNSPWFCSGHHVVQRDLFTFPGLTAIEDYPFSDVEAAQPQTRDASRYQWITCFRLVTANQPPRPRLRVKVA